MRIIGKKSLLVFLKVGLVLASLQCISIKAYAEESLQTRNDAYVDQVVGILRSHVLSMRMILDHDDLKYADNLVRHAEAFGRAFGMVGPPRPRRTQHRWYQYHHRETPPQRS